MAKRGRPSKNGARNGAILGRELEIVQAFDKARSAGEKYEAAIEHARQVVGERCGKTVSATEVKRVLSRFRPKDAAVGWSLEERILEGEELAEYFYVMDQMAANFPKQVPSNDRRPTVVRAISGSVGPIQRHPRVNRKIVEPDK